MIRHWEKANPVKDKAELESFAGVFTRCACCGTTGKSWSSRLTIHHLVKLGRSHERCNLLRLCWNPCHMLAEGERIRRADGLLYPKLTLGICLWLKRESDPEFWDPARLTQLRHSALPDLEPVPEVFLVERLANRWTDWK